MPCVVWGTEEGNLALLVHPHFHLLSLWMEEQKEVESVARHALPTPEACRVSPRLFTNIPEPGQSHAPPSPPSGDGSPYLSAAWHWSAVCVRQASNHIQIVRPTATCIHHASPH